MKKYQHPWTEEQEKRADYLMELKLKYEKYLAEITKELVSIIYKAENGRV